MSTPPDDIDAWLDRREPLFRRSASSEPLEPPAEIDNVVLARARAALRDGRSSEGRTPAFFTLSQWSLPLGLAATLVLAIAIVIRVNPAAAPATSDIAETADKLDSVALPMAAAPEVVRETDADLRSRADLPPSPQNEARREARRERSPSLPELAASNAAASDQAASEPEPVAPPNVQAVAPMTVTASAAAAEAAPAGRLADAGSENQRSSAATAAKSEVPRTDPLRWYQHIVALRGEGLAAEADREWRALKTRYPDFEPPTAPVEP